MIVFLLYPISTINIIKTMPDLTDIPGLSALRSHTKGDSRIKIAVLDGAVDLDRACFQGANLTRLDPY